MCEKLNNYLARLNDKPGLADAVRNTATSIIPKLQGFSQMQRPAGLLLGNVQSGKTSHVFGVITAAADAGYKIFILLTSGITGLQQQTLRRTETYLSEDFTVCGEHDSIRLQTCGLRKPIIIVLKKNASVLRKWKNYLHNSGICQGQPIFIVDDEADATSLNTMVNRRAESTIFRTLNEIRALSAHAIYLQLTATPQALFLQTQESGYRPLFVHYFAPGTGYLGGDFFYSEPTPLCIKPVNEDELITIREAETQIPDGLRQAFMAFLVSASDLALNRQNVCNFMIHPSVRMQDQEATANKIAEFLNLLLRADEQEIRDGIRVAWEDLHNTKPDIQPFENICCKAFELLDENNPQINIYVMNSRNTGTRSFDEGFNIVVGGNCLGRGITFPALQTIYYCRKTKMPQADTYWQHCRMFGYDRDRGLMRIFIPPSMLKAFTEMNMANTALLKQIQQIPIDQIRLIYPPSISPTRRCVIDKESVDMIAGGVDYFPFYPSAENTQSVDELLNEYQDGEYDVDVDFLIQLIGQISLTSEEDWSSSSFISCLEAWKATNTPGCTLGKLIIRRDRNISKGTGTLLSPDDRRLSKAETTKPVLTMYRLNGRVEQKWDGQPLWVPNIKMPDGRFFYKSDN